MVESMESVTLDDMLSNGLVVADEDLGATRWSANAFQAPAPFLAIDDGEDEDEDEDSDYWDDDFDDDDDDDFEDDEGYDEDFGDEEDEDFDDEEDDDDL